MLMPQSFRRILSPLLALFMVLTTAPISGLAAGEADGLIGSVSVVGPVQLRGVSLSREGTLFPGDRIRTREAAYARLRLAGGHHIELGSDTEIEVIGPVGPAGPVGVDPSAGSEVQIEMHSGTMAFSAPASYPSSSPLTIRLEGSTVSASEGSAGDLTFLEAGWVGVRALEGSMTVRSPAGTTVVQAGETGSFHVEGAPGPAAAQQQRVMLIEPFGRTALWVALGAIGGGVFSYLVWGREEASPN